MKTKTCIVCKICRHVQVYHFHDISNCIVSKCIVSPAAVRASPLHSVQETSELGQKTPPVKLCQKCPLTNDCSYDFYHMRHQNLNEGHVCLREECGVIDIFPELRSNVGLLTHFLYIGQEDLVLSGQVGLRVHLGTSI